jgi:predicted Fe-Mo cluster-binding NifX family protein
MKICVTATAANLEAQIDPRFGRCSYFVIVDSETMLAQQAAQEFKQHKQSQTKA